MSRVLLALALLVSGCVSPLPPIEVIDGDSVRVAGENVRLMGFNTPETRFSRCQRERDLGLKAAAELQTLINSGNVELTFARKRDGELRRDKYRRLLATMFIDGVDVAERMISAGLAEAYDGSGKRRDWCEPGL